MRESMSDSNSEDEVFCLKPCDSSLHEIFILDATKAPEFKLGKSADVANFVVNHDDVAAVHVILTSVGDSWAIFKDKRLTHPHFVTVNAKPLAKSRILDEGDEICLGRNDGDGTQVFRFTFEKFEKNQGQDGRQYDLDCPNRKCHTRHGREFLCEDCAYKEMELFRKLYDDGVLDLGCFFLGQKSGTATDRIPLKNVQKTLSFDSGVPWNYEAATLTLMRGRKGFYAGCLTNKLNPRSIVVSRHYPEEFHILLTEGDHIGLRFSEDKNNWHCYRYCSELEDASSDQSSFECEQCKPNLLPVKIPTTAPEDDEDQKRYAYSSYLVTLDNRVTIPLTGKKVVVGNKSTEEEKLDFELTIDDNYKIKVDFLTGECPSSWAVNNRSTNSVFFVNGKELDGCQYLEDGDVLQFGGSFSK